MPFATLAPQPQLLQALRQSVSSGRVPHGILFWGPPGTGRLPYAHAFAQYLMCDSPVPEGDACGHCASCSKVAQLAHPDLHIVLPIHARSHAGKPMSSDDFMDEFRKQFGEDPYLQLGDWAQRIGEGNKQPVIPVEDVRLLARKLSLASYEGKRKVVIIWQMECLNVQAANALLKLLEEPDPHTVMLLTTDDPGQLPPTLLSRCQRLRLSPLPADVIAQQLVSRMGADPGQAQVLSHWAQGSLAQAMHLLQTPDLPGTQAFIDWLRNCTRWNWLELQPMHEQMAKQPREALKHFIDTGLGLMELALHAKAGAWPPGFESHPQRAFAEKFAGFASFDAIEGVVQELEAAYMQLSRNAAVPLLLASLAKRVHTALATKTG